MKMAGYDPVTNLLPIYRGWSGEGRFKSRADLSPNSHEAFFPPRNSFTLKNCSHAETDENNNVTDKLITIVWTLLIMLDY